MSLLAAAGIAAAAGIYNQQQQNSAIAASNARNYRMFTEGNIFNREEARKSRRNSNYWNKRTMQYNRQEAGKARDWQEKMSNTEVQRKMEDMEKAGLNPMLMTQGAGQGASTPGGSSAKSNASGSSGSASASTANRAQPQDFSIVQKSIESAVS